MGSDCIILEQAITLVDHERSHFCKERRAYEAFREQIRLATSDPSDATGPSETTDQVLAAYREEVMVRLDYEAVYGDTLAESLEEELSSSLANFLLSKDPFTQRRKRNLLVEITTAIKRREELSAELTDERAALETFAEELADIEETLKKLPVCSAREQPLEKLLVVWEVYDSLLDRCELLLDRRQQQIREAERKRPDLLEKHARNELLYGELDTHYPVLSYIARVIKRIDGNRTGANASKPSVI